MTATVPARTAVEQLLARLGAYMTQLRPSDESWLPAEFKVSPEYHADIGDNAWEGTRLEWGPLGAMLMRRPSGKVELHFDIDWTPVWSGDTAGNGKWLDTQHKAIWVMGLEKMILALDEAARPKGQTPEQVHEAEYGRLAHDVQYWLELQERIDR